MLPNSHIPIIPTTPPQGPGPGPGPNHMGWGEGIMGMWEFGGICELLCKLLCKLPRVGVGAFLFAPRTVRQNYLQRAHGAMADAAHCVRDLLVYVSYPGCCITPGPAELRSIQAGAR